MGAGLWIGPGQRRQAVLNRGSHQFVISRVKLHQIDPMAKTVMTDKYRFVFIGQKACSHQWATCQCTVVIDPRLCPTSAKVLAPVLQGQVDTVQVDTVQGRRLIGDLVGFGVLMQVHGAGSKDQSDGPSEARMTIITSGISV